MMKSKKWLISLGLAVVLVVAFALPACEPVEEGWWVSPYTGEEVTLNLRTSTVQSESDTGQGIREDLLDFGIHVNYQTVETTTYLEQLYEPYSNGWDLFVGEEEPSADPIADWIWMLITDPWGWGWDWAPTYWYDEDFNVDFVDIYTAEDPNVPRGELQAIANEELPMYMLYRQHVISAYRTNRWENWYNELGGPVYWFNPWSIYEVEWVGDGGTKKLTVGTLTDVPSLNMDEESLEHSNMGCLYKRMVYETLAAYPKVGAAPDDPNVFIPKLAVNYTVTTEMRYHPVNLAMEEAQVWTWELREGVKWHDGEDFTADDVEFSLENAISEWDPAKPICWEEYWEGDGGIYWWLNVTGPYEIEFIYEEPITTAHPPVWMTWDCIVPEHVFGLAGNVTYPDDWNEDPSAWDGEHIGTGAFKWAEYQHNNHHKWVRNDEWWGYTDPRFDQIDIDELWFQIFPSMESLTAAFQADEIDTYMASFSYANIPSFLEDSDITVEVVPGIAVYYLGFNFWAEDETADYYYYYYDHDEEIYEYGGLNYTVNPLHDKALRKAIAYAIDVQNIIDVALGGDTYLDDVAHGDLPAYAELADAWIYPESEGHNEELEMYEYNPTKAEQLLRDAGYTKTTDE